MVKLFIKDNMINAMKGKKDSSQEYVEYNIITAEIQNKKTAEIHQKIQDGDDDALSEKIISEYDFYDGYFTLSAHERHATLYFIPIDEISKQENKMEIKEGKMDWHEFWLQDCEVISISLHIINDDNDYGIVYEKKKYDSFKRRLFIISFVENLSEFFIEYTSLTCIPEKYIMGQEDCLDYCKNIIKSIHENYIDNPLTKEQLKVLDEFVLSDDVLKSIEKSMRKNRKSAISANLVHRNFSVVQIIIICIITNLIIELVKKSLS